MNTKLDVTNRKQEKGVALLIALFALLLISGVAVSLIMLSGTETAIAGNYKASTQAFYAAYAGIEEGRGRFWGGHPQTYGTFVINPNPGGVLAVGQVRYLTNPAGVEVVAPTVLNSRYGDNEYQTEFGVPVTAAIVTQQNVGAAAAAGVPQPMYKWIRITAKTERSGGIDINGDAVLDNAIPVFYDGTNQNLTFTGRQLFRITALSMLPNGSRRMLQYDAAPVVLNLQFPSALTFDGSGSALFPATSNVYTVNGNDAASCGTPAEVPRPAIGVVTPGDDTNITNSIPPNRITKYTGSGGTPDVQVIPPGQMPGNLQDPQSLESVVSQIRSAADQVIQGPATEADFSTFGSYAAPTIAVVDGDLALAGSITGYGILVVTGNYVASGTVGWRGIVLVVGTGNMEVNGGGNNSYEGSVLMANTRNPDGTIRSSLGPTVLNWAGGGGNGVHYDSCHVNNSQNNVSYRVLSFREIAQ